MCCGDGFDRSNYGTLLTSDEEVTAKGKTRPSEAGSKNLNTGKMDKPGNRA
jgi:hypothetical protein